MIYVENIRGFRGEGIVIMRGKSALGNPFIIGKDGDRTEVIAKYRRWLWEKIKKRNSPECTELRRVLALARRGDVHLICCCAPLSCHGDVIKAAVEWMAGKGVK